MSVTKFRDAHILWAKNHKDFVQQIHMSSHSEISYIDVLHQMYYGIINQPDYMAKDLESLAKYQLEKDMARFADAQVAIAQILLPQSEKPDWFVTLGFNHQTWSVDKCKEVIQKVLNLPFIQEAQAVFELYRENGQHPHCHFYIVTNNKIPKSKILEKIWAVAGIKKVILNKNFIDVKIGQPVHKGYVRGKKQDYKLQYVEKDMDWRKENNIPDLFEKH